MDFRTPRKNVGKCGPSWAPVAASPFRHGAFRPSNLQWIFIFHNPRVPKRRQFQAINLPNADVVSACADMVVRAGESQGPRSRWKTPGSLMGSAGQMNDLRSGPATLREWLRKKSARHNKKLHNRQQLQLLRKVHPVFLAWKIIDGQKRWWWVMVFSKIWWMLAVRMLYLWCLRNIFDTWFLEGWGSRPSYQKIGPLKNSGANGRRDWYRQNAWYGG